MKRTVTLGITVLVALSSVTATAAPAGPASHGPRLHASHPCPGQQGFTCSTLTVPVDHTGRVRGTLDLQVATADNADAPLGTMVVLSGGPGGAGVPSAAVMAQRIPQVAAKYRLVMIDQRGTGELGALNCPALQDSGITDLLPAPADVVKACAETLGERAGLYGTDQTVADLDMLRQSLGVSKMVVNGVSYGTFVAERYTIAFPRRVSKVVLDSVLPHYVPVENSLYLPGWQAQARVLRSACAGCSYDPAEDVAWLARNRPVAEVIRIGNLISLYGTADPSYRSLPPVLHAARNGDTTQLNALIDAFSSVGTPVKDYSWGLFAAALCTDQRQPWGNSATPAALRQPALDMAKKNIRAGDVWPYTPDAAVNVGFVKNCQAWPAVRPTSNPNVRLPDIPVLMLSGSNDLATPTEFAQRELAYAPSAELVVVPGEWHSIQRRERGQAGRDAVAAFLL